MKEVKFSSQRLTTCTIQSPFAKMTGCITSDLLSVARSLHFKAV